MSKKCWVDISEKQGLKYMLEWFTLPYFSLHPDKIKSLGHSNVSNSPAASSVKSPSAKKKAGHILVALLCKYNSPIMW